MKEKFSRGKIKILYTFLWKRMIKMLTIVYYRCYLTNCETRLTNCLEPVVFYTLSFMSLDLDLEQVFIEAEP